MLWSAFLYWDSWIELSRFLCHPNKPSTFWHLRWTFFSFGKVTVYSKIKSKKLSIKGSKRISAKSTEKSLEQPFQMYTRRYITGRFIIRVKSYYPIHRGWHYSCTHYFFHHSNKKRFSKVQGFPNHLASFCNLWKSMLTGSRGSCRVFSFDPSRQDSRVLRPLPETLWRGQSPKCRPHQRNRQECSGRECQNCQRKSPIYQCKYIYNGQRDFLIKSTPP